MTDLLAYIDGLRTGLNNRKGSEIMTNEQRKLHYIYDEALKVEREYAEVAHESEKVDVSHGDYVVWYYEGKTDNRPARVMDVGISCVDVEPYYDDEGEEVVSIDHDGYRKLTPTGNVRIGKTDDSPGKLYTLTERKAAVGESILTLVDDRVSDGFAVGDVFDAKPTSVLDTRNCFNDKNGLGRVLENGNGKSATLTPVEDVAAESPSAGPRDAQALLANLVRRVAELEQQSTTHYAVNKEAEEREELTERIQRNFNELTREMAAIRKDVEAFAQTASNAEWLANSCADDIAQLDERTQPEQLAETIAQQKAESKRKFNAAKADYYRKGGCV